jgi:hypothetical protein
MSLTSSLALRSAVAAARRAYDNFNDRRIESLFRDLAVALGARDDAEAERILSDRLQHDWAIDGVQRGLDSIMNAICNEARPCVAALVAEYIHREKAPDRQYKRVAAFLADVTAAELHLARQVCGAVAEVAARQGDVGGVTVDTIGWVDEKGEVHEGNSLVRVQSYVSSACECEAAAYAPLFERPEGFSEVLRNMGRHGLGVFSGLTDEDGIDLGSIFLEMGEPLNSVVLLGTCLQVFAAGPLAT